MQPPGKLALEAFDDVGRAVGRAVVDDQYVEGFLQAEDDAENVFDVLFFVVRRDNDDAVRFHTEVYCLSGVSRRALVGGRNVCPVFFFDFHGPKVERLFGAPFTPPCAHISSDPDHSRTVSPQKHGFRTIPERFHRRNTVSEPFPNGFNAETRFLNHSRAVSTQKHGFWTVPERFHRRNTVSGPLPSGFTAETRFPKRSRTVSTQKHSFRTVPERFQRRYTVSEPFPDGFAAETRFPDRSRAVSPQSHPQKKACPPTNAGSMPT